MSVKIEPGEVYRILRGARGMGLTARQIADQTGCTRKTISKILRELSREQLIARSGAKRNQGEVWVALDA